MLGLVAWVSTVATLICTMIAGIASGNESAAGAALIGLVAAIQHPPWGKAKEESK